MVKKINNRSFIIPDEVIVQWMKNLDITQDEAIKMWLDDNGYSTNQEQVDLDNKAKTVKIDHGAKSGIVKERKPRQKKVNYDKQAIIAAIHKGLLENIYELESVTIRNDEKYIDFTWNNVEYTINLVGHTYKKAKGG